MNIKKKVIVIDESAFIRGKISEIINNTPNFEVIEKFRNISGYLKQIIKLNPDIIVLDLNKAESEELVIIQKYILKKIEATILVISNDELESFKKNTEEYNFENIQFIKKDYNLDIDGIKKIEEKLKVKLEVCINKEHKINYCLGKNEFNKKENKRIDVLLIGASTGGPRALTKVLKNIKEKLNIPVLIVQHMPVGFTKTFAERLNKSCVNFEVLEAKAGMKLERNKVYVAKGGIHMKISNEKSIVFDDSRQIWGVKPAVDKLFISAAKVYRGNVLACILTGMGRDGADGIREVKKRGGLTIAESEETCLIYGMPKAAIETGDIDYILNIDEISNKIEGIIKGE